RGDIMAMLAPLLEYTAQMVRELNDRHDWRWPRYEVVDGELLVSPAPRKRHQVVVRELVVALHRYLERERVGEVLTSPADISWGSKRLVQPDVFVFPSEEASSADWPSAPRLLLVAEVLSESSERADRVVKRRLYQSEGVPLYWVLDVDARAAEIWTPAAGEGRIE